MDTINCNESRKGNKSALLQTKWLIQPPVVEYRKERSTVWRMRADPIPPVEIQHIVDIVGLKKVTKSTNVVCSFAWAIKDQFGNQRTVGKEDISCKR